jgi:hypothetical protein
MDKQEQSMMGNGLNDLLKPHIDKIIELITNHIKGGKLSVPDLTGLLQGAYDGREQVGNWLLDKDLSTANSKVYYDKDKAVVAHKGTSGAADWFNNAVYAVGGTYAYKKTKRFKDAEKVQKEAESKYGAKNISTIGHSQAGLQAELLGKDTNEIITLNKATRPFSNSKAENQYDIRTDTDVVSGMNPFQKKNSKEITIKADTYNPFESHDIERLDKLDGLVGQGITLEFIENQQSLENTLNNLADKYYNELTRKNSAKLIKAEYNKIVKQLKPLSKEKYAPLLSFKKYELYLKKLKK